MVYYAESPYRALLRKRACKGPGWKGGGERESERAREREGERARASEGERGKESKRERERAHALARYLKGHGASRAHFKQDAPQRPHVALYVVRSPLCLCVCVCVCVCACTAPTHRSLVVVRSPLYTHTHTHTHAHAHTHTPMNILIYIYIQRYIYLAQLGAEVVGDLQHISNTLATH